MKDSIVENLKELLDHSDKDTQLHNKIKAFEEADRQFNELVEKGLAERRGNQLMPFTQTFKLV